MTRMAVVGIRDMDILSAGIRLANSSLKGDSSFNSSRAAVAHGRGAEEDKEILDDRLYCIYNIWLRLDDMLLDVLRVPSPRKANTEICDTVHPSLDILAMVIGIQLLLLYTVSVLYYDHVLKSCPGASPKPGVCWCRGVG